MTDNDHDLEKNSYRNGYLTGLNFIKECLSDKSDAYIQGFVAALFQQVYGE